MLKKALYGVIALSTIFSGVLVTSCNNTPGPGTAEVKVRDNSGQIQKQVQVKLFCTEPECVVVREGRTNDLGIYTQLFDLPVVLRVRAVRYDTTTELFGLEPNQIKKTTVDSVCGEGFIQVENDLVASETITILSCN